MCGYEDKMVRDIVIVGLTIAMLAVYAISGTRAVPTWTQTDINKCNGRRGIEANEEATGYKWGYNPADKIRPRLWLGNICAAMDTEFLKRNNIGLVVSMAREWPIRGEKDDILFISHPFDDSVNEDATLVKSSLKIVATYVRFYLASRPGREVLIYCNMGISRSTTAVVYTMMYIDYNEKGFHQPMEDYLDLVRSKRPGINPNVLFMMILNERGLIGDIKPDVPKVNLVVRDTPEIKYLDSQSSHTEDATVYGLGCSNKVRPNPTACNAQEAAKDGLECGPMSGFNPPEPRTTSGMQIIEPPKSTTKTRMGTPG